MLDQQTAKKKQLALWTQYQKNHDQEKKALSEELQLQSLENFERVNSCVPDSQNFSRFDEERKFGLMNSEQKTHAKAREHVENLNKFNSQILRKEDMILASFWVPALTPSESAPSITKPDKRYTCPVDSSSHFIKRKKLIPVKCEREERSSKIICKCCKKTITHQKAGVISICGDLICMTCIHEYCKEACVACGISMSKKCIIELTPGGTMFSAHNAVEAKVVKPVFNC